MEKKDEIKEISSHL